MNVPKLSDPRIVELNVNLLQKNGAHRCQRRLKSILINKGLVTHSFLLPRPFYGVLISFWVEKLSPKLCVDEEMFNLVHCIGFAHTRVLFCDVLKAVAWSNYHLESLLNESVDASHVPLNCDIFI
jgi:hypothetical protein